MPQSQEPEIRSQSDYKPTDFSTFSWEVIGNPPGAEVFMPMEVGIQPTDDQNADPMFGAFDEEQTPKSAAKKSQRWHLPRGMAGGIPGESAADEDAGKIKITPQEIDEIKAQAFEQGRQAGKIEVSEAQNKRLGELEKRFAELIADMHVQIQEAMGALEKEGVALSIEIARKIIEGAVEINPEYILPIIRQALHLTGGAVIRRVKVSPQDHEFIEVLGIAKQFKEFDGSWEFVADETVRAGCVVETSAGSVDFELDRAWERVKENVLKVQR